MKLIIDAQLPRRLADGLRKNGHDAIHTIDLPDGNRTTDEEILRVAGSEDRLLVTKDADFLHFFYVRNRPARLLLISTGNISNSDLEQILMKNLSRIIAEFEEYRFLELTRTSLIVHA